MPYDPNSKFKRELRLEVLGYFLVALCALPIRFALFFYLEENDKTPNFLRSHWVSALSVSLIVTVFLSKLRLRYKLALTFLLVAV